MIYIMKPSQINPNIYRILQENSSDLQTLIKTYDLIFEIKVSLAETY